VWVSKLVADRHSNPPDPHADEPLGEKSVYNRSDRLESWKEIASYLKREVRTVQRWEKDESLPVHRHQHRDRASVFAYKAEIDAWWHNDHARLESRDREGGEEQGETEIPTVLPAFGQSEGQPPVETGAENSGKQPFIVRYRRQLWLAGAAVAAVAAAAVATYFLRFRPSPALHFQSRGTVLIADFENRTGDPVFDGTLRQGLAAQLDQSPFLYIVSDRQIAGQLRLMSQPADARLTQGLALQVCQRVGGAAVLDGSIARIGSQYNVILDAVNCSTGASLTRAEAVASDKDHVLGALSAVAASMRRKLGESFASIRKFNKPLADVTTPSLDALKAYGLGSKALLANEKEAAIESFKHAVSLDPNFAMAYAKLGAALSGYGSPADGYLAKAYSLRNRVSERERFYVVSHYITIVTGDLLKANQVYKLWARTYPQDKTPFGDMGFTYLVLGQYDKAVTALRHAIEMSPPDALNYGNLARCYMSLNRLDAVTATIDQARARGLDSQDFYFKAYEFAFLRGDSAGMKREAERANRLGTDAVFHDLLLYAQAQAAASTGHLSQARDLSARGANAVLQSGYKGLAAQIRAEAALREAAVGNVSLARRQATAAREISNARYGEATAGIALALAGDAAQARRLAHDLATRFPQDTIVQFNFLPTIRAAVALDEHDPRRAIGDLQKAVPYELGFTETFVDLYPAYVRGLAFLAARQGPQAAAEFQKILDHPGVAIAEIIVPLAHLGLARARLLSGDKPGARKAYQDYLALWQHADPGIPVLRQAKTEYARIH
jgi:tetratricopeptide (TPR) repeat protein